METENPQQQNFQSFDYYGSPNGQTPQNTNQPSGGGGGGGMLMNRLEHDFHETQFPRDEGFRFLWNKNRFRGSNLAAPVFWWDLDF